MANKYNIKIRASKWKVSDSTSVANVATEIEHEVEAESWNEAIEKVIKLLPKE